MGWGTRDRWGRCMCKSIRGGGLWNREDEPLVGWTSPRSSASGPERAPSASPPLSSSPSAPSPSSRLQLYPHRQFRVDTQPCRMSRCSLTTNNEKKSANREDDRRQRANVKCDDGEKQGLGRVEWKQAEKKKLTVASLSSSLHAPKLPPCHPVSPFVSVLCSSTPPFTPPLTPTPFSPAFPSSTSVFVSAFFSSGPSSHSASEAIAISQ